MHARDVGCDSVLYIQPVRKRRRSLIWSTFSNGCFQLFDDRGRVQCIRETMCGIDQSLLEWEGCCDTLHADTRKPGIT